MSGRLNIPDPVWITDNDTLASYCATWVTEPFIAVDTEFVRTSTFYPDAGLIQIADKDNCYLIDPLKITDWQAFASFLENPLVVKVFHACAEDLEVCRNLTGAIPSPVADTQTGAALAGVGGIMGFQRLVKAILNVDLDKGETRSDWLKRPLSEKQIRYAVADVYYLYKCYPKLVSRLKGMDRLTWWHEDCERVINTQSDDDAFDNCHHRVKLAWKLRPQEQHVLYRLSVWREQTARHMNVPRNQVVTDSTLWNMARFKPDDNQGLTKSGVRSDIRRQSGSELLELIENSLREDQSLWPQVINKPLTPQAGEWFKMLRRAVADKAVLLDIPPDMLVKKKTLEALLRSGYPRGPYELPEPLQGWRRKEIADYLLILLQEKSG